MKSAEMTLVANWFKNIDEKNFDANRALMADNHKFHNPMTPQAIGPDEHIGMMQMMTGSFEGTHHADIVVEQSGWVAVHGHWSGKHVGEFEGIPATGNKVEFTWSDMFQIENGKVVNEYFEMNPMSIMAQIGGVPA